MTALIIGINTLASLVMAAFILKSLYTILSEMLHALKKDRNHEIG
jgi:hypothetical protein